MIVTALLALQTLHGDSSVRGHGKIPIDDLFIHGGDHTRTVKFVGE
jgi:hypothetical protein